MSSDKSSEYHDLFLEEAEEHIQTLNKGILELEKDPTNKELLNDVFRSAHTIKGSSAAIGYVKVSKICEAIEDLLGKLRDGKIEFDETVSNILLNSFDTLEKVIKNEDYIINLDEYLEKLKKPTSIDEPLTATSEQTNVNTIRVKMEELDNLVALVRDLILSKIKIEKFVTDKSNDEMKQNLLAFNRICSELQDQSMKLRLVPLEQAFDRFPRMVRDLAKQQNKRITFKMETSGVELDRSILDMITDPLIHILRNAVDHGIEKPQDRKKLKKKESASLKLKAYRESNNVILEISDDGRGIDYEKLKQIALEKKILAKEEAESITKDNLIDLLATPGLSTSSRITSVSGRGVGFDVVKKSISSVGGQIRLKTTKDYGTTITLTIPVSLAIVGGLLIRSGGQKFVIPLSSVVSIRNINQNEVTLAHGKEVIQFRDKPVPLVKIAEKLGIANSGNNDPSVLTVVMVEVNGIYYGLLVDNFEHKQETVIMDLPNIGGMDKKFSNATILSDGTISLILDPELLVKEAIKN